MSAFFTTLKVENEHGPTWALVGPLRFWSTQFALKIEAPTGFVTDFASIPPLSTIAGAVLALTTILLWLSKILNHPALAAVGFILWLFAWTVIMLSDSLLCDNLLDAPATIHDYLYSTQLYPRWQCDRILHDACLTIGVAPWKAFIIWLNVRLGGWLAWHQDQKKYNLTTRSSRREETQTSSPLP